MFHNSQRQGGTELCLNAEAAMTGHREQEPDWLPRPPCLVRFQEAFPSEEPLDLRGLSGNQEGG